MKLLELFLLAVLIYPTSGYQINLAHINKRCKNPKYDSRLHKGYPSCPTGYWGKCCETKCYNGGMTGIYTSGGGNHRSDCLFKSPSAVRLNRHERRRFTEARMEGFRDKIRRQKHTFDNLLNRDNEGDCNDIIRSLGPDMSRIGRVLDSMISIEYSLSASVGATVSCGVAVHIASCGKKLACTRTKSAGFDFSFGASASFTFYITPNQFNGGDGFNFVGSTWDDTVEAISYSFGSKASASVTAISQGVIPSQHFTALNFLFQQADPNHEFSKLMGALADGFWFSQIKSFGVSFSAGADVTFKFFEGPPVSYHPLIEEIVTFCSTRYREKDDCEKKPMRSDVDFEIAKATNTNDNVMCLVTGAFGKAMKVAASKVHEYRNKLVSTFLKDEERCWKINGAGFCI